MPKKHPADFADMKRRGERIAMVTAYDAPSARLAAAAGLDMILVGDSAAMTMFGHDATTSITMDEMIVLTRGARRGAPEAFLVADLPFGSYQPSDETAIENAIRFVKDAGADAVKLEGAGPMLRRVGAIVDAGIAVMGHIGLTPQSAALLGGYKPQGRTATQAQRLVRDAHLLERAGCFAIVLEAMPSPVADAIARAVAIPTIGIGAGHLCDGQVLVWHDLLGLTGGHVPRFVKQYASIGVDIVRALQAYAADVRAGRFPDASHEYSMSDAERALFEAELVAPLGDDD